jgi:phenylpropionate dioxygenase-like ring-hydroxylating dioxygenase large terminal subunit
MAAPTNPDMKYARQYPDLGTGPLPTRDCTSQEYFELESQRVFRRSWLCIGRDDQVPNAGDYFVRDLKVVNTSILVLRGRDGKLRAFHNYCAHRLNKLMRPGEGNCKAIACQFHGWVYDFEGRLVHLTNEHLFADFDRSKHGLHTVHLDTWEGFIFINLSPKPEVSLKEWIGPLYDKLTGYFEGQVASGKLSTRMDCNWKLAVDSQTEGYHAPNLHRRSLKEAFSPAANPTLLFAHAKLWGKHRQLSIQANVDYKPTPAEAIAMRAASFPMFPAPAHIAAKLPKIVNQGQYEGWAFDIFMIFPNLLIALMTKSYVVEWFYPESSNRTVMEVWNYAYKPETYGDLIATEFSDVMVREVNREDFSTLEGTQEGMEAGIQNSVFLCDEEFLVRHGHGVVAQMIGEQELESRTEPSVVR